jgi:hypothetical protein
MLLRRVYRRYKQNIVQPVAFGAGINEMAADGSHLAQE